jgi:hypothetical protein
MKANMKEHMQEMKADRKADKEDMLADFGLLGFVHDPVF